LHGHECGIGSSRYEIWAIPGFNIAYAVIMNIVPGATAFFFCFTVFIREARMSRSPIKRKSQSHVSSQGSMEKKSSFHDRSASNKGSDKQKESFVEKPALREQKSDLIYDFKCPA